MLASVPMLGMRNGLKPRAIVLLAALVPTACVPTAESRDTQAESAAGPPPAPTEHATAAGMLASHNVSKAPPPARPPRPSPRAEWFRGYWHWDGVRYAWVPGHWETPDPTYAWPRR